MKLRVLSLAPAILSLLSGLAFATNATFTAGDILMGFHATGAPGNGTSYVVNLGPVSTLRDATSPVTLTLGDLKSDLDATFGTDWPTRTDLYWGVAGTPSNTDPINGDPVPTLYGSKAQSSPGVAGTAWSIAGSSTRGGIATNMMTLQNGFPGYSVTANSSHAVLQDSADFYDWASFMAPGGDATRTTGNLDFGGFTDIEANPSTTLSLFRLPNQKDGLYVGYFSISSAGVVTFTPPSTALTFATWSATNCPGQTAGDDYDNDGLANGIEYFMGTPGNSPTASPALVSGTITWPRATDGRTVASFGVQISSDLGITDAWHTPSTGVTISASSVIYTPPTGLGKTFARLVVTP